MTAFFYLLRRTVGPTSAHVDEQGIIDGLRRGELQCIDPKAKDAHLWILIWEELHRFRQEGVPVEVEHVEAHRSKKEKQAMKFSGDLHTGRLGLSLRGSLLPELSRACPLVFCVALCIANDHVRDHPFSSDPTPSHIGSSAWFLSCEVWVCFLQSGDHWGGSRAGSVRFSRRASSCSLHASVSGTSPERAKPEASFLYFCHLGLNLSTELISRL